MHVSHMTVFTTALCNLDCNYCYICKDAAGNLLQIDKDIENDFKENNQIKQVLEYDPEAVNTIRGVTLWGGEPFLFIDRFIDNIEAYFTTFKNFNFIDTSTNFTIPNQVDQIKKLVDAIDKYYTGPEQFRIDLQISIDGYEEMNDYGRGQGVTKKFLQNFNDLLKLKYNHQKIKIYCHTKPTLSKETFHFVDNEEGILKWFNFFEEEMIKPFNNSHSHIDFAPCLWNCAQPTEWSSADGKEYAKIAKLIMDLSPIIKGKSPYWSSMASLVPEAQLVASMILDMDIDQAVQHFKAPTCGGGCGSFIHNIVPIPHGLFTMCHRGLFDAYVEYSNNFKSKDNMNNLSKEFFQAKNSGDWIYTKEELHKMQDTMSSLDCHKNQIRYTDLVVSIREYAMAGLIDKRYQDIKTIEKTLGYFLLNSYCLQDAYIFTGSWTTASMLEVPLLYNGVMEVVEQEIERVRTEKGWKIN